jgi:hypothetical protein
MPTSSEGGYSFVRVNRALNGYTWQIQVAAADDSSDALREAKVRALAISTELREELTPEATASF